MANDTPLIPGLLPINPLADPTDPTNPSASGHTYSERSLKAMEGIHPDLRAVCDLAMQLSPVDFVITEGLRTVERERQMVAEGKSRTMDSRHIYGKAVDFVDYPGFTWKDDKMTPIADAFKAAAAQLNIPIHWGGDWSRFVDSSHIELDRAAYPN